MIGKLGISGELRVSRRACQKAPLAWRVRNALRWSYLFGWFANRLAKELTVLTGVPTITAELALRLRKADGTWIDYGVVGYRVVTTAGAAYLVDDFDNATGSADISLFNFHGVGTGTNAEDVGDTALQTESTTILTVNSTRATGVRSQPTSVQYRSTGAVSFDGSGAITEHGLFTTEATGTGTLWDRTVFAAVNVASGDSISAQYTVSVAAGS